MFITNDVLRIRKITSIKKDHVIFTKLVKKLAKLNSYKNSGLEY